jgi:phosphinothricin acetyltransferase
MLNASQIAETPYLPGVRVRDAHPSDVEPVRQIYAYHATHSLASFDEEAPDLEEMLGRYAAVRRKGLPFLVAEIDGRIVGYCYATIYRGRSAHRFDVEDSIYIDHKMQGMGIGRRLLDELIQRCERQGYRQMIAIVGDSANAASLGLHERLGFREIGRLEAVGYKLGQWVNTVIMQRPLGDGAASRPLANPVASVDAPPGR